MSTNCRAVLLHGGEQVLPGKTPHAHVRSLLYFCCPALQSSFRLVFAQPVLTLPINASDPSLQALLCALCGPNMVCITNVSSEHVFQALHASPWLPLERPPVSLSPPSSLEWHASPAENHCLQELKRKKLMLSHLLGTQKQQIHFQNPTNKLK